MNKKILITTLLVTILTITFVNAEVTNTVLSLTLKYDNGKISDEGARLIEGSPPDRLNQPEEGYTAKVISFNNEELYSFKFSIELTPLTALDPSWFDDEGNQIVFPEDTMETLTEKVFVLNFPFFKNAKTIEIYDLSDGLILEVDISEFALCNQNNVCDEGESYNLCPDECKTVQTQTAKEEKKGICGPTAIVLLAMLPLVGTGLLRRKD